MAVAFPKFKLAKDFSPSLVQLGRIVKLLWLMTHSTGADVPVPETEKKIFCASEVHLWPEWLDNAAVS